MKHKPFLILSLITAVFVFLFFSYSKSSAQEIDCEVIFGVCQPVAGQQTCEQQGLTTPECPPYPNCCQSQWGQRRPTCEDVACLAPGDPTPTPNLPLECPNNFECVDDPVCDGVYDFQRECSSESGDIGNCCQSLGSPNTQCAIMGGSCRTAEECQWDETEVQLLCTGSPPDTRCCLEAPVIASCPPLNTSGGTCRDSCQLDECEYSQVNECMEAGQKCCLQETVATGCGRQEPQRIFCDSDGQPVEEPTDPDGNPRRIYTAIGCIPSFSTDRFIATILPWFAWIGGGIALLMITFSGALILSSGGDPRKVEAGKKLLTAAITGLLLIIFSAFILRMIGVNILRIPEF